MVLSVDGKRAVSGAADNTVRVWDLEGNCPPKILEGHTQWVSTLALNADGRHAVSGSKDRTVRIWDMETDNCLAAFICDDAVSSCAWARERERILAVDEGGNIHLFAWEE